MKQGYTDEKILERDRFKFPAKTVLAITIIMNSLVFTYQSQLSVIVQKNLTDLPIILGVLAALEGLGATFGTLLIANFPFKRGIMIFSLDIFLVNRRCFLLRGARLRVYKIFS